MTWSEGPQSDSSHSPLESTTAVAFPKPPSPPPPEDISEDNVEADSSLVPNPQPLSDPPPPYPTPARDRRTTRIARRLAQTSGDTLSVVSTIDTDYATLSPTDDGVVILETTPLISPRRRPRTVSHSTVVSTHSLAHTVLSIFQPDEVAEPLHVEEGVVVDAANISMSTARGGRRYFRAMWRKSYYRPLVHLLFINFPYALLAFLYLFVGTLTGTALLIALPLGVLICWLNLIGARTFARGEIALQSRFHGPLAIQPPNPPNPIFSRPSTGHTAASLEAGQAVESLSFLRNTYEMFMDQTSYQAIFYFLVIKPSITLFLTIALLVVVPIAFALILPAPAVLRAVKRVGNWQANLAIEGLSRPRL